jgi:mannose-6-phosphate isomerase-like protein (cupin superfamily)
MPCPVFNKEEPMKYVFSTENCKRYCFPTHVNELVIDRSVAQASEVFMVEIEPGKGPPVHQHDDTEQVFYVVSGRGTLMIGPAGSAESFAVVPGDVVLVPASTPHTVRAEGGVMRYVAVDSFVDPNAKDEPTWDEHVQAVCDREGWAYDDVVK